MENASVDSIQFIKVDQQKIGQATWNVNGLLEFIRKDNRTDSSYLIRTGAAWIAHYLDLKGVRGGRKTEPWWKRRIEWDIKRPRKDIMILEKE